MHPRQSRDTFRPVRPRFVNSIVRSYPPVAMRRSRFLPVFFTVLTIAFVIALVLRLRNDMREATIASSQPTVPPVTGSRLPVPSGTVANATSPPVIKHPAPVYPQVTADYRQPTTASRQPATVNRQRVPVPAPQPQAQAQPSLISRMIAPITKAIAPGAQPKPATPAASQAPQISSSQQSTGSSRNPDKPASNPNDPKDPNSD